MKGHKMPYASYTQTTPTKLHNYLDEEEIRVMANLADIAFETTISQDPDLESVYDIVLDISTPDYKNIVQEHVTRHHEFLNDEVELDEDATDTENYFRHLTKYGVWPEGTLLIGADEDLTILYDEAKTRLGIEPNALPLLAATAQE